MVGQFVSLLVEAAGADRREQFVHQGLQADRRFTTAGATCEVAPGDRWAGAVGVADRKGLVGVEPSWRSHQHGPMLGAADIAPAPAYGAHHGVGEVLAHDLVRGAAQGKARSGVVQILPTGAVIHVVEGRVPFGIGGQEGGLRVVGAQVVAVYVAGGPHEHAHGRTRTRHHGQFAPVGADLQQAVLSQGTAGDGRGSIKPPGAEGNEGTR